MNDISARRAEIWNMRLKACMDKAEKPYTQNSLASAMNKEYSTSFTQTSVSRWLSVGNANKNNKNRTTGFPEYETMILIADFFEVDIGYLTGETDSEVFSLEKASTYLAADDNAVQSIRQITHADNQQPSPLVKRIRESFNYLMSSSAFFELFSRIYEMYNYSPISGVSEIHKFDSEEEAHGYASDVNESMSLSRFKVYELFYRMLDDLYPYSITTNFLIADEEDSEE